MIKAPRYVFTTQNASDTVLRDSAGRPVLDSAGRVQSTLVQTGVGGTCPPTPAPAPASPAPAPACPVCPPPGVDGVAGVAGVAGIAGVPGIPGTPGEPCPPCPPCPPLTGIDWGLDDTTLDVSYLTYLDLSSLISANSVTSVVLRNLETITGGDLLASGSPNVESFSAPELISVGGDISLNANPALSNIDFPKLATAVGVFDVLDDVAVVSGEFPALTSVGSSLVAAFGCPNLVSVFYPSLVTVGGPQFIIGDCPILVLVSFSSLVTIGGSFELSNSLALQNLDLPVFTGGMTSDFNAINSSLVSVNMPVFLPFDGQIINFIGSALSAASVNHVLARCVANAAYVTGTLDLSGGTNAAPTGQGIADKADLIARGVTVNTN